MVIGDQPTPNVIGIAKESGSAGDSIQVIIEGISDNHAGLIPGMTYYANAKNTLSLDKKLARIGLALSPSEILLDMNRADFW